MYTFDGRIRYSETAEDGYLKIESLIDYFQDCSSFQSEDLGVGNDYLKAHHCAWIVNFWQIDILRLPRLGDYVRTGTSPYSLKGFMGFRNFMMSTQEDERLVNANSVWSLFDLDKAVPVRVTDEMTKGYELFPKFDMEYLPRKITYDPEAMRAAAPVEVDGSMMDSNHHMNNAQYVRLALGFTDSRDHKRIRRILVEYRQQAHAGDVIYPGVLERENGNGTRTVTVSLSDAEGRPYAVVETTADYNQ